MKGWNASFKNSCENKYMLLGMLNEKEGKNFLELANIAMMANGDEVKEAEKAVLQAFKLELEMQDYVIKNKKQEELITAFQASTKKIKKAVIIELAGVLDADEGIDDIEDSWIRKLGEDLGFRDSEIKKMVRWTQDFNDLLDEAYEYINKR